MIVEGLSYQIHGVIDFVFVANLEHDIAVARMAFARYVNAKTLRIGNFVMGNIQVQTQRVLQEDYVHDVGLELVSDVSLEDFLRDSRAEEEDAAADRFKEDTDLTSEVGMIV